MKEPIRSCVICRKRFPKSGLLRFVKDENGSVHTDVSNRMDGRGAYICGNGGCMDKAVKKHGLDKVLSLLGLAMKAGCVASGQTATEAAIKNLTACLVIISTDASDNTKKHFTDMCSYRNIPIVSYSTGEELGHAIGKEIRSNLAVTDEGLSGAILKALEPNK